MLKILFILLLLFVFPSASYAQNSEALCSFLPPQNHDNASVGAAYVPGVDVQGRPVAPANLGGGSGQDFLPDVIRIPLNIDLAQRLDQDLPEGAQMEAGLGMIEIYKDGHVAFNGRDLTPQVYQLCGRSDAPENKEGAAAAPLAKPSPLVQKEQPAASQAPVYDGKELWGEGH